MSTDGWKRVKRGEPCPVCGRPNAEHKATWCLRSRDGMAAICPFTPQGAARDLGAAGYLHKLETNGKPGTLREAGVLPRPRRSIVITNWTALVDLYAAAARPAAVQAHAEWLGVSRESLLRLHIGLCAPDVWTFPMADSRGFCGIRTRTSSGDKKAFRGSRNGYFIPTANRDDVATTYFCEGPTDTAAMLSLGFYAVGRADCNTIRDAECACVGRDVVIVADSDVVGRAGAERLRCHLADRDIRVSLIVPPAKDIREWIHGGAGAADIRALGAV